VGRRPRRFLIPREPKNLDKNGRRELQGPRWPAKPSCVALGLMRQSGGDPNPLLKHPALRGGGSQGGRWEDWVVAHEGGDLLVVFKKNNGDLGPS